MWHKQIICVVRARIRTSAHKPPTLREAPRTYIRIRIVWTRCTESVANVRQFHVDVHFDGNAVHVLSVSLSLWPRLAVCARILNQIYYAGSRLVWAPNQIGFTWLTSSTTLCADHTNNTISKRSSSRNAISSHSRIWCILHKCHHEQE